MVEETKPIEPVVEAPKKPSFLEEVKAERVALEKIRDELKELRATEIISGTTDAGQKQEVRKEETAEEYKDRIMSGG